MTMNKFAKVGYFMLSYWLNMKSTKLRRWSTNLVHTKYICWLLRHRHQFIDMDFWQSVHELKNDINPIHKLKQLCSNYIVDKLFQNN